MKRILIAAMAATLFSSPLQAEHDTPIPAVTMTSLEVESIRPRLRPAVVEAAAQLDELPRDFKGAEDHFCLAVAIYHEARGEPREGQEAVASVILQRAFVPGRWGNTVCEVVRPVAFSFVHEDGGFDPITEPDAWATALEIAMVVMAEGPDPWLEGADHYHATHVSPKWSRAMPRVARIGRHIFYADPRSAPTG